MQVIYEAATVLENPIFLPDKNEIGLPGSNQEFEQSSPRKGP